MKLFRLSQHTNPEYGSSYDKSKTYYLANDIEEVVKRIKEDKSISLSKNGDIWEYSRYYSVDREEVVVELKELECTICG